jgi:hypothetical protein
MPNVVIEFQSADHNAERNPLGTGAWDVGFNIEAAGFDLDHDSLTVYPRGIEMDENLTLARKAPFMNESGEECGMIGWIVQPEPRLLRHYPELAPWAGRRYGRVIVTGVDKPA